MGKAKLNKMDELTLQSATRLAALIRDRIVSPVEVVEAYLDRIGKLNPKLNAIVTLAHHLNMQVTATGVESAEQVALLQKLECDSAQGHFFSDALDAQAAEKLLANPKPLKHSA